MSSQLAKINKFYTHLTKTADEAVKRMQDKRPPIHNATLFVNGETLEIPFNADSYDAIEAMILHLRDVEKIG